MTIYLALFFAVGVIFGLLSFPVRHLFSEGPTQADHPLAETKVSTRLYWLSVCTFLWPLLALTGLNSAWIIAKRKRRAQS